MQTAEAQSRVETIARSIGNADALSMKAAADNLANGCAAFWHTASYSNDPMSVFFDYLNRHQDVERAIEAYDRELPGRVSRFGAVWFLDHLLPLNAQAVESLGNAFEMYGTFWGPDELVRRTERAEELAQGKPLERRRVRGEAAAVRAVGKALAGEAA